MAGAAADRDPRAVSKQSGTDAALIGVISIAAYVAALVIVALDHSIRGPKLASSPAGVANGRVVSLLTSGLAIDGPAWPQIAVLAVVLFAALRQLGAVRLWAAALAAHVGATLLAYIVVWLAQMIDRPLAGPMTHAPDYGISVVLTGELGALAARTRRRGAVAAGTVLLAAPAAAAVAVTGTIDPFALSDIEHALGFALGALFEVAACVRATIHAPKSLSRTTP